MPQTKLKVKQKLELGYDVRALKFLQEKRIGTIHDGTEKAFMGGWE